MPFQQKNNDRRELFFYLLVLTGFFILLEISFFIQSIKAYLGDFSVIPDQLHIPYTILPDIFYFGFAQLSLHILYCILVWIITLSIAHLLKLRANKMIFF